jgi:hypothetical protein
MQIGMVLVALFCGDTLMTADLHLNELDYFETQGGAPILDSGTMGSCSKIHRTPAWRTPFDGRRFQRLSRCCSISLQGETGCRAVAQSFRRAPPKSRHLNGSPDCNPDRLNNNICGKSLDVRSRHHIPASVEPKQTD